MADMKKVYDDLIIINLYLYLEIPHEVVLVLVILHIWFVVDIFQLLFREIQDRDFCFWLLEDLFDAGVWKKNI